MKGAKVSDRTADIKAIDRFISKYYGSRFMQVRRARVARRMTKGAVAEISRCIAVSCRSAFKGTSLALSALWVWRCDEVLALRPPLSECGRGCAESTSCRRPCGATCNPCAPFLRCHPRRTGHHRLELIGFAAKHQNGGFGHDTGLQCVHVKFKVELKGHRMTSDAKSWKASDLRRPNA